MAEDDLLVGGFEANRAHLRGVAYRLLGSHSEADDAVQEAWLRLSRAEADDIQNLRGWLTTVVARVCLDMLRARASRREEPLDVYRPDADGGDPEQAAQLADSVGLALLVMLETLSPTERLAFVLHDVFGMSFDEIAPVVGRSPAATRKLASRARLRLQGATVARDADLARRREVVTAFLAASRAGDFGGLMALLAPDVVLTADPAAVAAGASKEVRGAAPVADTFAGRARFAQVALINGAPGAVWAPGGQPRVVFGFAVADGKIVEIRLLADPERLRELDLTILDEAREEKDGT
ncbi:MAG: sigma-70 family RNA polymerase sigma factor [Anaerolineae bacterium]